MIKSSAELWAKRTLERKITDGNNANVFHGGSVLDRYLRLLHMSNLLFEKL